MLKSIAVRVVHAVLSLLVLLAVVFILVRLSGDPTYSIVPQDATPEIRERYRERWGLNDPIGAQFVTYLANLAQGDLGVSFSQQRPVTAIIAQRLPATATMAAGALIVLLVVGIPLGIYAAYWRGGRLDRVARFGAAIGQATPSFWVGLILLLIFAVHLRILPSGGYGSLEHLILPSVTLAFAATAGLIRLLRSSMIEVLAADYIKFHRAKGLPERLVLWKHALRNAGMSSITFVGVHAAGLITGSVLVETVFVWPGIGRMMIEGIEQRDYPVVQGGMLFFASAYIAANLLVDVVYVILNPRLR